MKFYFSFLLPLLFVISSCNNEAENREITNKREAQKREIIFENISKAWHFSIPQLNPETKAFSNNWEELRLFMNELNQYPKSSIGAFQKKAIALSTKAMNLNNNIPEKFNKPEIRSRISVLISKVNSINLYINLHQIPDQKIIRLLQDTNQEIASLGYQMEEIIRKENIPAEEGESDMIRMLDTTRAIPSSKK